MNYSTNSKIINHNQGRFKRNNNNKRNNFRSNPYIDHDINLTSYEYDKKVKHKCRNYMYTNLRCSCNHNTATYFINPLMLIPWLNNETNLNNCSNENLKWNHCIIPTRCYDCNDKGFVTPEKRLEQLYRINFWCRCSIIFESFLLKDSEKYFGYKVYICKKCKFANHIN